MPLPFITLKLIVCKEENLLKDTALATAGVTILNFPIFGKNAPSNKVVLGVMGVNSGEVTLLKIFRNCKM